MSSFMQKVHGFLWGDPAAGMREPAEIHISQVGDEVYNAGAPNATANCGPATVLMAVRLFGLDVPGAERYRGEDLIAYVRQMMTGNTDRLVGTNNLHLDRVLKLSGISSRVLRHPKDMLSAVRRGEPVIMGGNPTVPGGYTARFDYIDIRRWDSGHWVLVARHNPDRNTYTVNDPQSTIGPIEATGAELTAFSSRDGNFGLALRRA
jgi:hypothetical protein